MRRPAFRAQALCGICVCSLSNYARFEIARRVEDRLGPSLGVAARLSRFVPRHSALRLFTLFQ